MLYTAIVPIVGYTASSESEGEAEFEDNLGGDNRKARTAWDDDGAEKNGRGQNIVTWSRN
jgi:hypothetical protein